MIDRVFLNQIIEKKGLYIDIKKTFLIKIYKLNIRKHDACEYVIILMYILNKSDYVALIRREIHIINNLFVKAFININIIKPKTIVFNINKDLIIIKSYKSLYISMFMIIKDLRINAVIKSKARYFVSTYFFLIVFIKYIALL